MKIKNYILFVLILGLIGIPSAAQKVPTRTKKDRPTSPQTERKRPGRDKTKKDMSVLQLASILDTNLTRTCDEKAPRVAPSVNAHKDNVFSIERIEKTLTGVWRGRVKGNYEKTLLAKDGFVNVDYYMIVDAKRGEALVFEQFGSTRAAPQARSNAPTWSYVFCGKENYKPRHPPQVHEFHKVSDNVEDARALLSTSTGLKFAENSDFVLSDIWRQLVDTKYFDNPRRSLAYAGGLFKPFKIGNVPNEGGSLLEMDIRAEYRGSGLTAARFEPGVPMHGVEKGKFLGVETSSGDYLVSSFDAGVVMAKESTQGGLIDMFFDKVVIGPLAAQ